MSDYSDNESFKSANDGDGHTYEDASPNVVRFPPEEEAVQLPSVSSLHHHATGNANTYFVANCRILESPCRIQQAQIYSKWDV